MEAKLLGMEQEISPRDHMECGGACVIVCVCVCVSQCACVGVYTGGGGCVRVGGAGCACVNACLRQTRGHETLYS